jgi:hypothetical protein
MSNLIYVIPCGGAKASEATRARDLYVGSMFQHTLRCAESNAAKDKTKLGRDARILILSAKHGLIELDAIVAPYDQRMNEPGSISAEQLAEQAQALGLDWDSDVYTLLPAAYRDRLDAALRSFDCYPQDVYEATAGIGEQRRVNACIAR